MEGILRIVWIIVKRLLQLVLLLVLLLIVWFVASSFYDEKPKAGLEAFFHLDAPLPDSQNGYLALGGLDAPSEAQMLE